MAIQVIREPWASQCRACPCARANRRETRQAEASLVISRRDQTQNAPANEERREAQMALPVVVSSATVRRWNLFLII